MNYKGSYFFHNIAVIFVGGFIVNRICSFVDTMYFYQMYGTYYIMDAVFGAVLLFCGMGAKVCILVRSVRASEKYASKKAALPSKTGMKKFCRIYYGVYAAFWALRTGVTTVVEYLGMMHFYEQSKESAVVMNVAFDGTDILVIGCTETVTAFLTGLMMTVAILYMITYACKIYGEYEQFS